MYKIAKTTKNSDTKFWVNDSEGIPMEFETYQEAKVIKDLFQSNTTHNSIYTIHPIGVNISDETTH